MQEKVGTNNIVPKPGGSKKLYHKKITDLYVQKTLQNSGCKVCEWERAGV